LAQFENGIEAVMAEVLTAAQMRAIEAAAIATGAVSGLDLMERAGRGVVAAMLAEWPDLALSAQRAVVLCGPGGNGGDGYVVARLLAERGWQVICARISPPLTADAQAMAARWQGAVQPVESLDWPDFQGAAVCVDAMFGTGLQRDIAPGVWGLLEMALSSGCRLVAVDILSGICADSGRVRAQDGFLDWPADLTVSFQRAKLGHYLAEGGALRGRLALVDIGLEQQMQDLLRREGAAVVDLASVSAADLAKGAGHKFDHGHALIVSGDHGRAGAARLSARAALRVGAGLVTLASPPAAMAENAARLDAVMLREVAGAEDLAEVLEDARIKALCLGPALGLGRREAEMVALALRQDGLKSHPTVLDADALTLIAREAALFDALHGGCVLTPHAGEFARLFPDLAAKLAAPLAKGPAYSKLDATRDAAARAGCVVLYKGADTVIAAPDGRCAIHAAVYERAAPWLATAGSGDVLAGLITGLLARGFSGFDAACAAAWLHVEAARSFGPGLIAEDLADELPKVFRQLGL
jgi:ADP-dependent NAD(P)H-hydrate dehydratase / NAD(P)H-hydrate epimerase